MSTPTTLDELAVAISIQTSPASLTGTGPFSVHLIHTAALLNSIRLTAIAEITDNGFNPREIANPIDRILSPDSQHPIIERLTGAISISATSESFTPIDPIEYIVGDEVRLLHDATTVGVPNSYVGNTGLIARIPDVDRGSYRVEMTDGIVFSVRAAHLEPA